MALEHDVVYRPPWRCRCRRLYEKYLEWDATRCASWARFAELENSLDETERARGIYELAIAQPQLDMPEVLLLL